MPTRWQGNPTVGETGVTVQALAAVALTIASRLTATLPGRIWPQAISAEHPHHPGRVVIADEYR
jgi:hypothetical protein